MMASRLQPTNSDSDIMSESDINLDFLDELRNSEATKKLEINELSQKLIAALARISELEREISVMKEAKMATDQLERERSKQQDKLTLLREVSTATKAREMKEILKEEPESLADTEPVSDRCRRIRQLYHRLTGKLEAGSAARYMFQENALTPKELETIRSLHSRPTAAAEVLLNIVTSQPNSVFSVFLDSLKPHQKHVYNMVIESDSEDCEDDCKAIQHNYVCLVDKLDLKGSDLLHRLSDADVVDDNERAEISAKIVPFIQNETFLSVLRRKSNDQFQLFLQALEESGQRYLQLAITRHPTLENVLSSVSEPVYGLAVLQCQLYVLHSRDTEQIDVHSTTDQGFLISGRISVPHLAKDEMWDMTSCSYNRRLYISNRQQKCIHLLTKDVPSTATIWPVVDSPFGLAVTETYNLLVACTEGTSCIYELNHVDGAVVRKVKLQAIEFVRHAIQQTSGLYLACHGGEQTPHRLFQIGSNEDDVNIVYGNTLGSDDGQLNLPRHVTTDKDGFIFVADSMNNRVVMLNQSCELIRYIGRDILRLPVRLCCDRSTDRLFVGQENGHVAVFTLCPR